MAARAWMGLVFLSWLAGCGQAPSDSFFPLDAGLRWEYRVTETTTHGTSRGTYGIENIGTSTRYGEEVSVRRTDSGLEYHFLGDGLGATRVAVRTLVEIEPRRDAPLRTVLPATPKPGAQWQATTRPYLLKRNVSDGIDLTRGNEVEMTYRIVATDAAVNVPAGDFADCVHVVGEAQLRIFVDGRRGYSAVPLRTEEWYARGVGLVKLRREENVESDMLGGGTLEMVLLRLPDT